MGSAWVFFYLLDQSGPFSLHFPLRPVEDILAIPLLWTLRFRFLPFPFSIVQAFPPLHVGPFPIEGRTPSLRFVPM